jgi:DNA topoisomerase-1
MKAKELVIVESPAKAKTLGKILGNRYLVKASSGHVRDLPKNKLGVNVKKGFAPQYVVVKGKEAILEELKETSQKTSKVYLACDPDREGEAISWHLMEACDLKDPHRVIFHEITEEAIRDAFKHPREIDLDLVNAQQARRILDRLVGYKVSPMLWQKVGGRLSAGRVQSVALRMIIEREREIESFVPQEYWTIETELKKLTAQNSQFRAKLVGTKEGKIELSCREEADKVAARLKKADYAVIKVTKRNVSRQPSPPFITSTLQQEAWRKLHFSAERTMRIAQQLYEGLPIGKEGVVGLITYMRTDSTKVADSAIVETRQYIKVKYGGDFLPPQPRQFAKKVKGAQEAHEAIRPTKIAREPENVSSYLNVEQAKLYELIWRRMVASQMAAALSETTTVDIEAKKTAETYLLRASGSLLRFPGFLAIYSESKDEAEEEPKLPLPELSKGDKLSLLGIFPEQHFTQPPPRYNEATLVKALEENGIGRPSTYAPIISTIRKRGYTDKKDGKFYPNELGFTVNDFVVEYFPDIFEVGFTAQMEGRLDEIAQGKKDWVAVLQDFYHPFKETLQATIAQIVAERKHPIITEQKCPKCGKPMVVKTGRYGKFLACSGYPECRTTKPFSIK